MGLKRKLGKICPKFVGPMVITKMVNPVSVRINLPDVARQHNCYHVNLLKKADVSIPLASYEERCAWFGCDLPARVPMLILEERQRDGATEFLVQWQGCPRDEDQWVPKLELLDYTALLSQWNGRKERMHSLQRSGV